VRERRDRCSRDHHDLDRRACRLPAKITIQLLDELAAHRRWPMIG